ncbi:MAG TPA: ETC complex I subunit [Stellaceae bacterium]|nr:ETC complex I subunit [Stellaceae bacterium]
MAQARIYQPVKTAMQSGRAGTRKWRLDYEQATPRLPDPLMGWTSAGDTLNQIHLHFDTLEEARAFAEKHGLDYVVIATHERIFKPKAYADNFRTDRPR